MTLMTLLITLSCFVGNPKKPLKKKDPTRTKKNKLSKVVNIRLTHKNQCYFYTLVKT